MRESDLIRDERRDAISNEYCQQIIADLTSLPNKHNNENQPLSFSCFSNPLGFQGVPSKVFVKERAEDSYLINNDIPKIIHPKDIVDCSDDEKNGKEDEVSLYPSDIDDVSFSSSDNIVNEEKNITDRLDRLGLNNLEELNAKWKEEERAHNESIEKFMKEHLAQEQQKFNNKIKLAAYAFLWDNKYAIGASCMVCCLTASHVIANANIQYSCPVLRAIEVIYNSFVNLIAESIDKCMGVA